MTFSRFAELVGQCCIQNLSSSATLRHYFSDVDFAGLDRFGGLSCGELENIACKLARTELHCLCHSRSSWRVSERAVPRLPRMQQISIFLGLRPLWRVSHRRQEPISPTSTIFIRAVRVETPPWG